MSDNVGAVAGATEKVSLTGNNLRNGGAPFPVEVAVHLAGKCGPRPPKVTGVVVGALDLYGAGGTSIDIHFEKNTLTSLGYGRPIGFSVTCWTVVQTTDRQGHDAEVSLGATDGDDSVMADQIAPVYQVASESNAYDRIMRMDVTISVEPAT